MCRVHLMETDNPSTSPPLSTATGKIKMANPKSTRLTILIDTLQEGCVHQLSSLVKQVPC